MRIVAGKFKSRIINAPSGDNTRPSSDKTRQAIFNVIAPYVYDANVLDIFSGSGALAIEAISRGAKNATLIDNNIEAVKVIKENVKTLKIENQCNIINDDYKIITTFKEKFDIILLDPPYKMDVINEILTIIKEKDLLSDGGIVVYESDESHCIKAELDDYYLKVKKYGIAYVSFLYKK